MKNFNKQEIINYVKLVTKKYHGKLDDQSLEEIATLIKDYLAKNPHDTEMWLRLVMLEFMPPREDPEKITQYLNTVLEYDPHNIEALLILAYMQYLFYGEIQHETYNQLERLNSSNPEILSMIEYAKALYYEEKNLAQYEKYLKKSIECYNHHVENYMNLGLLYRKQGHVDLGKKMIAKALENVQSPCYETDDSDDPTDINAFFNEYYKGTHRTTPNMEILQEVLKYF